MRICPKYKYDRRESDIYLAIWTYSELKKIQVFDEVLGNFENFYLRNAIKIIYVGGLGRFGVWRSKLEEFQEKCQHWKSVFSTKIWRKICSFERSVFKTWPCLWNVGQERCLQIFIIDFFLKIWSFLSFWQLLKVFLQSNIVQQREVNKNVKIRLFDPP